MWSVGWLVLLRFLVGAYGTLIGAGGGFVLVPILALLYPTESPELLASISLAVVFFNALSGSAAYARMGRIDYRSMKVLFNGGTGNISTACTRLAVERGIEIFLFNRGRSESSLQGQAQLIRGDIRDMASAADILKHHHFDVVVDWVAYTPDHIETDISLFAGRVRQYVFISSAAAYQKPPHHYLVTESTPLENPFWQYGRDKIACEERLDRARRNDGFPVTIVRPSLTYGETWIPCAVGGHDYTVVDRISALIDTIDSEYGINLQRVYATGMSMGGFMSYRLACELSDRIAAIASVTGLQAFYPCNPDRPVPVLQFHGTADPVLPYAGVPSTIANWVDHNLCPADPVITDLPDIDTTDNSTVTVSYYGLCEDSTEVILYTINGGEHTWPGALYNIGITNQDIKASYEIWDFFNKYNLQGSTGIDNFKQYQDARLFGQASVRAELEVTVLPARLPWYPR